ncbi:MAG: hypothetical protein LWW85_05110 [Marinilabiliales bacterium]|nr:hypothetical protein [Marinilabiliales bacterium]
MLKIKYPILLSLLLWSLSPVQAQQVKISASLEKDSIWLGDQIHMILVAEYPEGTQLQLPALRDSLGNGVEVIAAAKRDSSSIGDKRVQLRQTYTITAFDSGPHPIRPIPLIIRQSGKADTLKSNPLVLFVKVPNIDLKKGFADIKKPYGAPVTFKEVAPWIIGILLVASIVFLLIYALNRRKKNIPLFSLPPKPKLPPHVVALSELNKLKEEQLWQQDKVKDYYTRLTDIVRIYLEERFEVKAMEQTTDQTLAEFGASDSPISGKLYSELKQTLDTADLVKFAKYLPLPDENHQVLSNAFTLVEKTKTEATEAPKKQEAPEVKTTSVAPEERNENKPLS